MIVKYRIADGEIVCAGAFTMDMPVADGEALAEYKGYTVVGKLNDFRFIDGEFVEKNDEDKYKADLPKTRRLAYPPIRDQLDAIWKGGQAFDDMQKLIQDVKIKYPKQEK